MAATQFKCPTSPSRQTCFWMWNDLRKNSNNLIFRLAVSHLLLLVEFAE
jgi:hypothetical protein